MTLPERSIAQDAADDRELFGALGRLPHHHDRARRLVEGMLDESREGVLADAWRAAARSYLLADTNSQRSYAAETLRELHQLHFALFGITATKPK